MSRRPHGPSWSEKARTLESFKHLRIILGGLLEPSWGFSGASWAVCRASWTVLGPSGAVSGRCQGLLGRLRAF
eukprot:2805820-Pyramimonas_sp.AAC.1